MPSTMTVAAKVLGQKNPLGRWSIPIPAGWQEPGARVTVRDLIAAVVLEEVQAFRTRQEEQRLTRILTEAEIAQGVEQGKVEMGGRDLAQVVDPQAAVATALQAFDDGLYFVFVDAEQQISLDSAVSVQPGAQVTFVRLVALAGG